MLLQPYNNGIQYSQINVYIIKYNPKYYLF